MATPEATPVGTRYKVEMDFCGSWGDAEWQDDGKPARFNSIAEAEQEIKDHIEECEAAVAEGNMTDAPSRDEFRIVPAED